MKKYTFKSMIDYFTDRNRLAFTLNIAYGLLMIIISIVFMKGGTLGETSKPISIIEIAIGFLLLCLGIERVIAYNKLLKDHKDIMQVKIKLDINGLQEVVKKVQSKTWILIAIALFAGFGFGVLLMLIKS